MNLSTTEIERSRLTPRLDDMSKLKGKTKIPKTKRLFLSRKNYDPVGTKGYYSVSRIKSFLYPKMKNIDFDKPL